MGLLVEDIRIGNFKSHLVNLGMRGFDVGRVFWAAPKEWSETFYLELLWDQVLLKLEEDWIGNRLKEDFLFSLFERVPEFTEEYTFTEVIVQRYGPKHTTKVLDCVTALQGYLSDFFEMSDIEDWLERHGLPKVKTPSYIKKILGL